jgi:hypothetical protein
MGGRFAPWCALNPSAKGFPVLKRIALPPKEAIAASDQMMGMLYHSDPMFFVKAREARNDTSSPEDRPKLIAPLEVWRYEPQLDVDNDGVPEHVLQLAMVTAPTTACSRLHLCSTRNPVCWTQSEPGSYSKPTVRIAPNLTAFE